MNMKKIIAVLLAVLMLAGTFVTVVGAEEATKPYEYNTNSKKPTVDYAKDQLTAEQKIESMDYRYGNGSYELYVDAYSGEVAVKNVVTGEMLFTNPYNFASMEQMANLFANDEEGSSLGAQVLSQLKIYYKDKTTGMTGEYNSFAWSSARGQMKVKDIRGGIRVEYSIGKEESRLLIPERITKETFDKKIRSVIEASSYDRKDYFFDYFTKFNPDTFGAEGSPQRTIELTRLEVSIQLKEEFYVLDPSIDVNTKQELAQVISQYCPNYTYEDIDEDHLEIGYDPAEEAYPTFKMALEYTLDEKGLSVRLPANGIRYDDQLYTLENIEILPFMGVGTTKNGYTFFPDGSGTLFSFSQMMNEGQDVVKSGTVYGADFAYQEISGDYTEVIRYPVFGVYETEELQRQVDDGAGNITTQSYQKDRGFLAIVEEGESMMTLTNYSRSFTQSGAWQLNGVRMTVQPRPKDSFKLEGSTADDPGWDVVSAKKFSGSFRIRYIMLTDADLHDGIAAATGNSAGLYDCSYVGMAKAYREYLIENGVLTRLTAEDVKEDIPLYIEALGSMMTTEKILSIPVDVMTALTSFSDLSAMRDQLAAEGITNINFILNGFAKGGLTSPSVPYKLKWENAVEDDMTFEELVADAQTDGYGIYPDFDFVFAANNTLFDGLTLKDHAVKTVENRYTSKRVYSATKHATVSTFEIALSPAYFSHFYEKFLPRYQKYQPIGISVGTLGSYLNSDFDEDEPFNREESKSYTAEAFKAINDHFAAAQMKVPVMTEAANAYTWKYVDHITDIALDSSRYRESYASVPFLGIVLHGYVQLAGTPVNMEGNLDYAMLKSIESGAALQFLLAYDNTDALKDDETLSQNFSVQYDIWRDDIISMYHELNNVLKTVQTSVITNHQFINGVRVPDLDELLADARQELEDAIAKETASENKAAEAERAELFAARAAILEGTQAVLKALDPANEAGLDYAYSQIQAKLAAQLNPSAEDEDQLIDKLNDAELSETEKKAAVTEFVNSIYSDIMDVMDLADELIKMGQAAKDAMILLDASDSVFTQEIKNDLRAMLTVEFENAYVALCTYCTPELLRDDLLGLVQSSLINPAYGITQEWLPAFAYTVPESNGNQDGSGEAASTVTDKRYDSEANKIVRVSYENGADFLLNFNDYQVIVNIPVGGVMTSYTLEAFGYIVLNQGTN